jgi:spore coat polysaccharide biosynthesis protein SpsF
LKLGIALSIRDKSTRLPSKTWANLGGLPLIKFMLERLDSTGLPVFIATSTDPGDDKISELNSSSIRVFRGHPEDKLQRYLDLCEQEALDFLVVVDGDDPLIDLTKILHIVDVKKTSNSNLITFENFALGISPIGISKILLAEAVKNKKQNDSEVWLSFVRNLRSINEWVLYNDNESINDDIRLTIDYPEDLLLIEICLSLLNANPTTPTNEFIELLNRFPKLCEINSWRNLEYNSLIQEKSAII